MDKILQSIKEAVAEKNLSSDLLMEFVELRDSDRKKDERIKLLEEQANREQLAISNLKVTISELNDKVSELQTINMNLLLQKESVEKRENAIDLTLAKREIECLKDNIENIKQFNEIIFKNTVVRNKVLTNICKPV